MGLLGNFVKKYCIRKLELARQMGVSQSYIYALSNKDSISDYTLTKIINTSIIRSNELVLAFIKYTKDVTPNIFYLDGNSSFDRAKNGNTSIVFLDRSVLLDCENDMPVLFECNGSLLYGKIRNVYLEHGFIELY